MPSEVGCAPRGCIHPSFPLAGAEGSWVGSGDGEAPLVKSSLALLSLLVPGPLGAQGTFHMHVFFLPSSKFLAW